MRRSGFTLLEVAVALGLLAGAVCGLAHLILAAADAGRDTRRADTASTLALERMEQLRSLAWGYEADGMPREDLWTDVAAGGAAAATGHGLSLSPPGSLESDTPGFVDYLDGRGQPLDPASESSAAFVRRWLVAACPDDPSGALILRVLVIRREGRALGAPEHSRGAVVLTTLKARRTW